MSKIQDLRTWMVLFELLMIIKTKESIVVIFSKKNTAKNVQERDWCSELGYLSFRIFYL